MSRPGNLNAPRCSIITGLRIAAAFSAVAWIALAAIAWGGQ